MDLMKMIFACTAANKRFVLLGHDFEAIISYRVTTSMQTPLDLPTDLRTPEIFPTFLLL